jgi:hypothetical protein
MCPSGATCRLSHGLVSVSFSSTMKIKPNMTVDKADITSSKCSMFWPWYNSWQIAHFGVKQQSPIYSPSPQRICTRVLYVIDHYRASLIHRCARWYKQKVINYLHMNVLCYSTLIYTGPLHMEDEFNRSLLVVINPRGYHPPSRQWFGTDIVY